MKHNKFTTCMFFAIAYSQLVQGTEHGQTQSTPLGTPSNVAVSDNTSGGCSLDSLTNSCKAFSAEGPKVLPNGLPNYASITQNKDSVAQKVDAAGESRSESSLTRLKLKQETLNIVEEMVSKAKETDKPFSKVFETYMQTVTPNFLAKVSGHLNEKDEGGSTLYLPWPPESDNASFQEVNLADAKAYFKTLTTEENKKRIVAVYEKDIDLTAKMFSGGKQNPETTKLKQVSPEREKEVSELVNYAKQHIINLVSKGEKNQDKLSEAQKNAIKKIESIKLNPIDKRLSINYHCVQSIPNAFYSAMDHSFTVCPQLYNFPNEALIGVIAHEIGHAVDPCLSQFGTYTLGRENIQSLLKPDGKPIDEIAKDDEKYKAFRSVQGLQESGVKYCALPLPFYHSPDDINFLVSKGILKPESAGTPFNNYVFQSAYQCLKASEGGGFRSMDVALIDHVSQEVTELLERQSRNAGIPYDAAKDQQKIREAFNAHPECTSPDKHSQMGEAVADWIGSKVTGEYLKGKTLEGENRMLPVGFFASLACLEREGLKNEIEQKDHSIGDTINRAEGYLARLTDPHPETESRIQEIFLRDENIRKAIGCKKGDKESCS